MYLRNEPYCSAGGMCEKDDHAYVKHTLFLVSPSGHVNRKAPIVLLSAPYPSKPCRSRCSVSSGRCITQGAAATASVAFMGMERVQSSMDPIRAQAQMHKHTPTHQGVVAAAHGAAGGAGPHNAWPVASHTGVKVSCGGRGVGGKADDELHMPETRVMQSVI